MAYNRCKEAWPPRGSRLVSMIEGGSGIGCHAQVGIPWSQEEFLEQAQKAEHTFSKQALLPDRVLTSMSDVLSRGPSEVSKFRRRQLEYWMGRAAELEAYKQEVQEGLHGSVKECLKWKRTELLKEMLVEARVPSPDNVVALLQRAAPPFEPRQVLEASAAGGELVEEVADRTDEEVRDGKAQGPFDEEEVDKLLGKCWSPCRRVGSNRRLL